MALLPDALAFVGVPELPSSVESVLGLVELLDISCHIGSRLYPLLAGIGLLRRIFRA